MKFLFTLAALVAAASASAEQKSGRAEVAWVAASATYRPSQPVETAIRLKVDPGWHTYWINPGEGGMKTSVGWTLPADWTAGPVGWPVPVRFETGGLPGFGYVGEVWLPVTLTPPAGATGPVTLEAKIDWLTCADDACVPGEATLTLELKPGEPAATPFHAEIARAKAALPRAIDGLALDVREDGQQLALTLRAPAGLTPEDFESFPATPQVIDPGAPVRFSRQGEAWIAKVPKSEYLERSPALLELVVTGGGLPHPALVTWTKK
jgi:thiol:disulfide interchange protein DsbD